MNRAKASRFALQHSQASWPIARLKAVRVTDELNRRRTEVRWLISGDVALFDAENTIVAHVSEWRTPGREPQEQTFRGFPLHPSAASLVAAIVLLDSMRNRRLNRAFGFGATITVAFLYLVYFGSLTQFWQRFAAKTVG